MRDDLGPARVHFASRLLEARLLALGERWHEGPGRSRWSAAGRASSTRSGALAFALALHARGWRIAYLGADTPVAGFVGRGARRWRPSAWSSSFTMPWALAGAREALRRVALDCGLVLAGPRRPARAGARLGGARGCRATRSRSPKRSS